MRTAVRVVEVTIEQASRTVWWYSRPQKGYSGCRGAGMIFDFRVSKALLE